MDRRLRARRRSVSRERGRHRAGAVFLVVLVVAAAALFLWSRSSDVFAVRTVTANATEHVTPAQISQAVSSAVGANLLALSTGTLEEALERLPYVQSAQVYRAFPHGLEVRVVERLPAARVETAARSMWLVAEDGTWLEEAPGGSGTALPLVVTGSETSAEAGATAPAAVVVALPVALLLEAPVLADRLPETDRILVSPGGEVVVRFQDGMEIRLGIPTDLDQKLMVSAELVERYLRDGRRIEYVDASAADRVAVKAE
jgi:cell division protein FtsQ